MLELYEIGTYRDGGSKVYMDENGNKYFIPNRIGVVYSKINGKLHIGTMSDPIWKEYNVEYKIISNKKKIFNNII